MDFRYSTEHVELQKGVRRLLTGLASEEATRQVMETPGGWDAAAYQRLAHELGVVGLAVPEEFGGSGYGVLELGLVLQEAGRALLCAPLLACSLATRALLESGDRTACALHLPGISAGSTIATLAALERGSWDAVVLTTAEASGDAWTVTGSKEWVLDAQTAGLLVVSAQAPQGLSLFLVDSTDAGVQVTPVPGVDPTRRQATVTLNGARAVPLGTLGGAAEVLARTLDVAVVLLAAEQLGVAERCLEMATAYAKDRRQFDRAIGSFQAVKHKLANVLLEVEAATSAVMYALWTADERPEELPMVASLTGATCSETALLAASENIQVHGGIGVTWEHPAHLYLKRATTDRLLLGDPQRHLARLADQLDAQPATDLIGVGQAR
jgi:alkylation response protein AidB-like acyl-CoA dehydrogenase